MNFFKWSNNYPLKINKFGIPEPESSRIFYPDILLVPLVGYDSNLNRLGYGGGFYDKSINKHKKCFKKKEKPFITIGLAHSSQETDLLPHESHDMKLDFIVTEKELWSKKLISN